MNTSHPSRVRELKRIKIIGYLAIVTSHPSRVRELKLTSSYYRYAPFGVAPLPGA